jgi:RNase H-like domain found in reverse transcriptase/Reverse transcriptase (RNA-dependent DNA polymerase)
MCLNALGGSKYFSTLDMRAGYWQTEIEEDDRDKTCFVTRRGTFRFKVLSFGLSNAPALFQRLMDLVLVGLTWEICLVFLDDVIIMSETFDEGLVRLKAVFDRLRAANLKLKPSKCRLLQREVVFLGHLVSSEGIAPDPSKVEAVTNWPRPVNLREVRAFVGLANYYRNFVKGFAEIARPLHELTKKNCRFEWTDRQEEAFVTLKRKLTEAPVLAAPRDEGLFILDSDGSDLAVGAVLQQQQDNALKVIAYASRSLSDAERNYCTTRKELLAVIFGLKQFRRSPFFF